MLIIQLFIIYLIIILVHNVIAAIRITSIVII